MQKKILKNLHIKNVPGKKIKKKIPQKKTNTKNTETKFPEIVFVNTIFVNIMNIAQYAMPLRRHICAWQESHQRLVINSTPCFENALEFVPLTRPMQVYKTELPEHRTTEPTSH